MRMLSTTSDCTPTYLRLQAGKEIFPGFEGLVFERMIQVANTTSIPAHRAYITSRLIVPAPFSCHSIFLRQHPSGCLLEYSVFFVLLASAFADWQHGVVRPDTRVTVSKTRSSTVYCWSSFLWNVATSILPFFIRSGAPTAHDVSKLRESH